MQSFIYIGCYVISYSIIKNKLSIMADIFDCLCCLCMCLFDDSARSCCAAIFGIGSCLGQICVYYKKNISGRS